MRFIIFFSVVFLTFSCGSKENNNKNRRFSIIIEHKDQVSGFSLKDDNDTLWLRLPINDPKTSHKIIINDETKKKIIDVIDYHFDIENFKSNKSDNNANGSVTFDISTGRESFYTFNTNTMTSTYKNIKKNTDVSTKYSDLIIYLKSKYPEFKNWPN